MSSKRLVQRTLLIGPYFLSSRLFAGHRGRYLHLVISLPCPALHDPAHRPQIHLRARHFCAPRRAKAGVAAKRAHAMCCHVVYCDVLCRPARNVSACVHAWVWVCPCVRARVHALYFVRMRVYVYVCVSVCLSVSTCNSISKSNRISSTGSKSSSTNRSSPECDPLPAMLCCLSPPPRGGGLVMMLLRGKAPLDQVVVGQHHCPF